MGQLEEMKRSSVLYSLVQITAFIIFSIKVMLLQSGKIFSEAYKVLLLYSYISKGTITILNSKISFHHARAYAEERSQCL